MTARAKTTGRNGSKRSRGPRSGSGRAGSAAGAGERETQVDFVALRAAAEAAAVNAHAPYSRLRVGAALADRSGRVFAGVNVENASFGLTTCAERNALAAAVAAGARALRAVVVVSSAPHMITPCGACRQVLLELAPDAEVRCYGRDGDELRTTVRELMPHAFDRRDVTRAKRARRSAPEGGFGRNPKPTRSGRAPRSSS